MNIRFRDSGFTLFEMLAVIVLLAIAATIVVRSMGMSLSGSKTELIANQLQQSLRRAQLASLASGKVTMVRFDMNRRIFSAGNAKFVRWPESVSLHLTSAKQLGSAIAFYPDGTSSGGHVQVIGAHRSYRLNIDWLTSAVRMVQ